MGVTIKPDYKLNGTLICAAAAAGARDLGLPIRRLFVKTAERLAPLGDGSPGLIGSRNVGHKTPGWDRHLTVLRRFALRHAETTGLLGRRGKIRWSLRVRLRRLKHRQAEKQQEPEHRDGRSRHRHGADGSTGFVLAATEDSA